MLRNDPILIAGPARSGTTMLAGLISKHGVWVGRGRTTRYPETNSNVVSENQDIKNLMKSADDYKNWTLPLPAKATFDKSLMDELRVLVPDDQRWLVKTSWLLIHIWFWLDNFPDAKWILPQRDIKDIISSTERHPAMRRKHVQKRGNFIHALKYRQKQVFSEANNVHWVDVQLVSQQDPEEIEKLFDFLNIELDWKIVKKFIEIGKMKTA